jgi:hypothetical protein
MPINSVRSGILAVALCAACAARAEGLERKPTLTNVDARKAVAAVVSEVETIRGLRFRKPVPVDSIDDARARTMMTARLRKFVGEEKLRADTTAWSLLGLVPAGTDLLESVLDALAEQAGGFYDPEAKKFFLLDDMPAALAPALAAHELTHALEDQYYDLDTRLIASLDDDDATFAKSAVHEGSALLVMSIHLGAAIASGATKAEDLQEFSRSEAAKAETLRRMPQVLQRQLIGPYLLGMNFLLAAPTQSFAGGFPKDAVERAYRNGPVSSEQLLHPEKFWDPTKRDRPKKVSLEGAGATLGPGWKKAGEGVLGELLVALLAGSADLDPVDPAAARDMSLWTNAAAEGWGGDRWELWRKGGDAVVLLSTVWDSERDAEQFAKALTPRQGLAWRQSGSRVAIVAGATAEAKAPLVLLAP